MYKQFVRLLLVFVLSLSLLLIQFGSIKAQGITQTQPATESVQQTTVPPVTIATDPNVITFKMFNQDDIQLTGPYDSAGFSFSIPAGWKLIEGAEVELSIGISFNTIIQNQANTVSVGGGSLKVLLNNQVLSTIPLGQVGEINTSIQIPINRLVSTNIDQSIDISFILESGIDCNLDQKTDVLIHSTSRLFLPHDSVMPDTNLINFPYPIYQNLIFSDSALLVVPDNPTVEEMKAALIVSAGLSNLTSNNLLLDLTKVSNLTADQQKANHILFIGKATSLPILKQLALPMPINNNQYQINIDDGVIQMINSPGGISRVILVVSGNSDAGVIKAAQAVSTGVIQPNQSLNLAVIDKVQPNIASSSQAESRTLAEMGYSNILAQGRGLNFTSFKFNIPPGYTLASDAYFELVYGNSALINFNKSGIVVKLNNRPIGSVRLSDVSAGLSINKTRISIPSSAITPGRNELQIVTSLWPIYDCSPTGMNQGLWVNIWSDSTLNLPLTAVTVTPASNQKDLATYLPAFISNPVLSDIAFVLPSNDMDAWRSALQIASYLGSESNGPITDLSVFYGDSVPESVRSNYNFLVVGRPSEIPVMHEINSSLPAPFLENSDVPVINNSRIAYRLLPTVPIGYIEIIPSIWNPNKVVLAILGNTTQGVSWSAIALTDPNLNWRLVGNFAIVNNRQILTIDTNIVETGSSSGIPQLPEVVGTPVNAPVPTIIPAQNKLAQSSWVLPALIVSVAFILLILVFIVVGSWSRNRTRSKSERGGP